MGAGKTFWLNQLKLKSPNSDFNFFDLDQEIANFLNIAQNELGDFIIRQGFPAFRKLEQERIAAFLGLKLNGILALGGGALNAELFKKVENQANIKIVFLNTPFEVCYQRIKNDPHRPLALLEKKELKALYEERLPLYLKAHLILDDLEHKEIDGLQALGHTLFSSN